MIRLASLFIEEVKVVDNKKIYTVLLFSGTLCIGDVGNSVNEKRFIVTSINKDGKDVSVVQSTSRCDITVEGVQNKLEAPHSIYIYERSQTPGVTFLHNPEVNHFKN